MFCFPAPHDRFATKTPWALLCIAMVDAVLLGPVLGANSAAFLVRYGFTPAHATVLTFFMGFFLHVGVWHYLGNMIFFWIFGRKVEATLGHLKFLGAYLLCGIGGQLLYWALDFHSAVPCVGASGAISGIAGIYFILYPKDRFDLFLYLGWWRVKTIESNARVAIGVWIGEQFLLGLITSVHAVSGIAFWAHVGGFAAGGSIGALYCARVPTGRRPSFAMTVVPLADEVAQPNDLIGLNLSLTSAKHPSTLHEP
jgi:membrane associated rhomboid family serine protease